jgi:hypothetical protein
MDAVYILYSLRWREQLSVQPHQSPQSLFRQRWAERRERIRQAMTFALEDLKLQKALAKPGTIFPPISTYLYHQLRS